MNRAKLLSVLCASTIGATTLLPTVVSAAEITTEDSGTVTEEEDVKEAVSDNNAVSDNGLVSDNRAISGNKAVSDNNTVSDNRSVDDGAEDDSDGEDTDREVEKEKAVSLVNCTLTPIADQARTGSFIEPEIQLYNPDGIRMVQGTDFQAYYSNNVYAGISTVTLVGAGEYVGTRTTSFVITDRKIADVKVSGLKEYYNYEMDKIIPNMTLTYRGEKLTKDVDYTVMADKSEDAGVASIIVEGKGIYTGKRTITYKIKAKNLLDSDVQIITPSCRYTGDEQKPEPIVTWNGHVLKEKRDYNLKYRYNTEAGKNAEVTISGTGNFVGERVSHFLINEDNAISAAKFKIKLDEGKKFEYNGMRNLPEVTVRYKGRVLVENKDYKIVYDEGTKKGKHTIRIVGLGDYYGVKKARYSIKALDISKYCEVGEVIPIKYTGKTKKSIDPLVTYTTKTGKTTLEKDRDYKISYKEQKKKKLAVLTVKGKGNFKGKIKTIVSLDPWEISTAQITANDIGGLAKEPNKHENIVIQTPDGKSTLKEGRDYTVETEISGVTDGKAMVRAAITGMNWTTGTVYTTYTMERVNVGACEISAKGPAKIGGKVTATVKFNGKKLKEGKDYTMTVISDPNDTKYGTVLIEGINGFGGSATVGYNIRI